jgi:hypothetical protein
VFAVPDPLPEVYVVGGAVEVEERELLVALSDPGFDGRLLALVPPGSGLDLPAQAGPPGEARLLTRTMNQLVVETRSATPGLLVVVEAMGSGWQARVDGNRADLHRVNLLFAGVRLSPGRHRIVLSYFPPGLLAGVTLTLVGLCIGVAALRSKYWGERTPVEGPQAAL